MSSRLMLPEKRKKRIYTVCVVLLTVAIVVVLLITFIPKMTGNSGTNLLNGKTASNLSGGFSCTVKTTADDCEYELNLSKVKDGGYSVAFVKPENLNSLSFETTDEGLKVKLGTLEAVVDPSSIPQKAIYDAVVETFDSCMKKEVKISKEGSDTVISGVSSVGDYTMTFGSDMKPKAFSIPSLGINAQVSDFEVAS